MDISSVANPTSGPQWPALHPAKAAQMAPADPNAAPTQPATPSPATATTPSTPSTATTATTATTTTTTPVAATATDAASAQPPSEFKSVTYGALGIDPPDGQPTSQDDDYRAGQWAGAALKVGGVIALLA